MLSRLHFYLLLYVIKSNSIISKHSICLFIINQKRNRRSCEQSCRQTPGCNYWVYVSRKERDTRIAGACYLKENKVSVRTNVKKRTSGPRNCNGNSNGGNGNSNGGGNGGKVKIINVKYIKLFNRFN